VGFYQPLSWRYKLLAGLVIVAFVKQQSSQRIVFQLLPISSNALQTAGDTLCIE
jgi:hypothetical protein